MTQDSKEPMRTQRRIGEELTDLLAERGRSLRWLAEQLGINVSFLSRAVRGVQGKSASPELIANIARLLEVPDDYFVETREFRVIERLRRNPELRERIYDEIAP